MCLHILLSFIIRCFSALLSSFLPPLFPSPLPPFPPLLPSLSLPLFLYPPPTSLSLSFYVITPHGRRSAYLLKASVFIAHFFCLLTDFLSTLRNKPIPMDSHGSLLPCRWPLRGCEIKFFIQLSSE